jgi:hypothetical protein
VKRISRPKPARRISPETAQTVSLVESWKSLQQRYFPDRLDLLDYQLCWSKQVQTRCLASCSTEKRRILVANAFRDFDTGDFLEPLLYHEMCHAVLGKPRVGKKGRRILHGREFKELEKRHPKIPALDAWIEEGGWSKLVRKAKRRKKVLGQIR